ncbi:hypothetical protein AB0I98_36810 [Streptomyces sp. NPDC050211]|uniref:hypothetical protein n=1 Tax=Streptomyces sp. NPDC050211 TaxID=3154932 RepID=UPI003446BEB6
MSVDALAVALIYMLRLLLDHAQDDPDGATAIHLPRGGTATAYGAPAQRRNAKPPNRWSSQPDTEEPDFTAMPDDLALGLRLLIERTAGQYAHHNLDRLAIEQAAGELHGLELAQVDG